MLNITQELSAAIAGGNHWLVYNETEIVAAVPSRNKARELKGNNKIKQWDGTEGFNLLNGHVTEVNPIEALQAAGLNPIVIDENTDFSKLPGPNDSRWADAKAVNPTRDEAFDNPHHGHVEEEDVITDPFKGTAPEMSEFAKDKEAMSTEGAVDPQPSVTAINPAKEAKPARVISHKSTVEKPTRLVHAIADMLYAADPAVTRKEIIDACTEQGIAHYTILTQYQAWKANRGE